MQPARPTRMLSRLICAWTKISARLSPRLFFCWPNSIEQFGRKRPEYLRGGKDVRSEPVKADSCKDSSGPVPLLAPAAGPGVFILCVKNALAGYPPGRQDRKSTRLNSSHVRISYAVF